MRDMHEWPGHWTNQAPRVEDHHEGAYLAWMVRGYPFTRPVLARSNVGAKCIRPQGMGGGQIIPPKYGPFVRVELMADSFHGQDASAYGWFRDLEWLGPIVMPNQTAKRRSASA
jgi:hypothetical protein